jgi:hypothetical protein
MFAWFKKKPPAPDEPRSGALEALDVDAWAVEGGEGPQSIAEAPSPPIMSAPDAVRARLVSQSRK